MIPELQRTAAVEQIAGRYFAQLGFGHSEGEASIASRDWMADSIGFARVEKQRDKAEKRQQAGTKEISGGPEIMSLEEARALRFQDTPFEDAVPDVVQP